MSVGVCNSINSCNNEFWTYSFNINFPIFANFIWDFPCLLLTFQYVYLRICIEMVSIQRPIQWWSNQQLIINSRAIKIRVNTIAIVFWRDTRFLAWYALLLILTYYPCHKFALTLKLHLFSVSTREASGRH